jgi:hypothetical protein
MTATTPPPDRLRVLIVDSGSPAMAALRELLAADPEVELVVVRADPAGHLDPRELLRAALEADLKR